MDKITTKDLIKLLEIYKFDNKDEDVTVDDLIEDLKNGYNE